MSYNASEIGVASGSPVELYKFTLQNVNYVPRVPGVPLCYTSSVNPFIHAGNTYVPYTMKRGAIVNQSSSVEQPLEITAFRDFPPAQLFRVQAPSGVLNLTVYRYHTMDPSNSFAAIWIGRVLNVAWGTNNEVKLNCQSDLASMKRLSLRRPYQLTCPHILYEQNRENDAGGYDERPCCNVNRQNFATTVTSFSANGRTVSVPGVVRPDGYFAGGYLTYMQDVSGIAQGMTDIFSIRASQTVAGVLQLTLALVPYGLSNSPILTMFAGCDHTMTTCIERFNNLPNYGGQPLIPGTNPFAGTTLF